MITIIFQIDEYMHNVHREDEHIYRHHNRNKIGMHQLIILQKRKDWSTKQCFIYTSFRPYLRLVRVITPMLAVGCDLTYFALHIMHIYIYVYIYIILTH